jgi:hypothetical protein
MPTTGMQKPPVARRRPVKRNARRRPISESPVAPSSRAAA